MENLIVILLVVVAAMVAVTLFALLGLYRSKYSSDVAEHVAGLVVEKLLLELKSQRQEAQAEAREQRREAYEMAQDQRRELAGILGASNAQTAQLIANGSIGWPYTGTEDPPLSKDENPNALRTAVFRKVPP